MEAPFVLSRPVGKEFSISQRFGEHPENYRSTRGHTGIDFDVPEGTPVHAAADGVVTEAGLHNRSQKEPDKGYGWYVRIQHEGKWNTLYTQLQPQRVMVSPSLTVSRGQLIGYSGNSGQAGSTPRLHFELRADQSISSATDPLPYLEAAEAGSQQESSVDAEQVQQAVPEPEPPIAAEQVQSTEPEAAQQKEPEQVQQNAPPRKARKTSAALPKRAATASASPAFTLETPQNTAEYHKGNTLLRVAETASPWRMAIDSLAVPAGLPFGTLNTNFNDSWFSEIGFDDVNLLRNMVGPVENLQQGFVKSVQPGPALGQQLLPFGGDATRWIFLASAAGSDGVARLANIPGVIQQVVSQAASLGVRKLAIPLIGAGGGGLNPTRVAEAMLTTLLGEIDLDGIQEISIITILPEVVEAASQKLNLYRNNLAQAISTDEAAHVDTLGIGPQVKALAETLMLRGMPGGIAVGILGSWGSGKTSVMKLIEIYSHDLLSRPHGRAWEDDPGDEQVSPYVGHVYPIWFNAWTYAKGNLWASLMDTIFGTLDLLLNTDENRAGSTSDMWEILRRRKEQEWSTLKNEEKTLAQFRAESKDLALTYQQQAQVELGKQGQAVAWDAFKEEVGQVADTLVEGKLTEILAKEGAEKDAIEAVNELRSLPMIVKRLQLTFTKSPRLARSWLVVSLACIVLPVILSPFVHILNNALVWLAGWIPMLLPPLRAVTSWLKQVDQSLETYRTRSEQEHRHLQGLADEWVRKKQAAEEESVREIINNGSYSPTKIEQELKKLAREEVPELRDATGKATRDRAVTPKNLAAYQALVKIQEAKVEQQRRRVGMVGRFTTLAEFVQSRLDNGFYENQLGPMRQVEKDIGELSDGLSLDGETLSPEERQRRKDELKKEFPRGPARVILFIDDLDRCPPPRVVEVLEATQLLLKTSLFVVVLGLDTRYATRALEKEYKEILQHDGDPSGMDYIEKIIQIPYRVRPIEASGLGSFLQDQMKPVEAAPERESPQTQVGPSNVGGLPAQAQTAAPSQETPPPAAGGAPGVPPPQATAMAVPVGQPGGPDSKTGEFKELPPAVVRFTHEDFEDVQACCQQIRLTPRSVKRLVNVMKLLEVFWFRTLGYDRERSVKRSVISLLTLAAAYPEVMVEVFTQMAPYFDNRQNPEYCLGQYLDELKAETLRLAGPSRAVLTWQFDRALADIKALRAMQQTGGAGVDFLSINFGKMGIETFNLVRSFSFIGDPAYTLEDAEPKPDGASMSKATAARTEASGRTPSG